MPAAQNCYMLLPHAAVAAITKFLQSFCVISGDLCALQELRGQLPLVELVEVPPPAGCSTLRVMHVTSNRQIRVVRPAPDCSAILAQVPKGPEG